MSNRRGVARRNSLWPACCVLGYLIAVGLATWLFGRHAGQIAFYVLIGFTVGSASPCQIDTRGHGPS